MFWHIYSTKCPFVIPPSWGYSWRRIYGWLELRSSTFPAPILVNQGVCASSASCPYASLGKIPHRPSWPSAQKHLLQEAYHDTFPVYLVPSFQMELSTL